MKFIHLSDLHLGKTLGEYSLIKDLLEGTLTEERIPFYAAGSVAVIVLIAVSNFVQYNATFLTTYRESGVRRTTIAEKLRRLPLSYFGKKNIADLGDGGIGQTPFEYRSLAWRLDTRFPVYTISLSGSFPIVISAGPAGR